MKPSPRNKIIEEDLDFLRSRPLEWSRFHDKTVIVTGASGFLPAYMVELLHSLGEHGDIRCKIVALVRNEARAHARFAHLLDSPRFELLVQDVCEPVNTSQEIDFIVHAASQASPKYYAKDPLGTFDANVQGTRNLLKLGQSKGIESFLFFSSGEVYGQVDASCIPITENDYGKLDPSSLRSCYAEGKRAGETLAVCWHHQHGVPTRIARPFHTYGPGMLLDDGRVFADFVADVVEGRNITMKSDGSARRAFCYISDATEAFFKILLEGNPAFPYNVGNPDSECSVLELATLLTDIAGEIHPQKNCSLIRSVHGNSQEYLQSPIVRNSPDISRLAALGWHPETDLKTGFKKTILSYIS